MSGKIRGAGRIRAILSQVSSTTTELQKRVVQRWKHPSGITRPVFLIGNVRSGTSMVVFQLAKSWQVKLYNEDNPAAFDYWRMREFSVIDQLLQQSTAPVTLFKPILDTYRIWEMLGHFPTAKAIFTFRHYSDVINSTHKRFYREDGLYVPSKRLPPRDTRDPITRWVAEDFKEFAAARPPEEILAFIKSRWTPELNLSSNIALRWYFINRLYYDLGMVRDERIQLVKYEKIVANPEKEFKSICEFLELTYEPVMIEGVFSSSIGKEAAPDIDPVIQADCDALFERLSQQVETHRN
ncbi:MAG: hypothetical protein HUU38_22535 [Anaerolineales bacterium]|nr:hypothetical protein [Anaerolineales bacterium]